MRGGNVKIANGAALSEEFSLGGRALVGIIITGGWTAADISLTTAPILGEEMQEVYWIDDNPVLIQAGADRTILFRANEVIYGLERVIFRSGTAAVPVNQGAERTLVPLLG